MYRTTTCGALRAANVGEEVTLAGEGIWIHQPLLVGHMKSEGTELFTSFHRIVATQYQDQVARLCLHCLSQLLEHLLAVEFIHTALYRAVFAHSSVDHSLGSHLRLLYKFRELV